MRLRALTAALVALLVATSGCFGFLDRGLADHDVVRTPIDTDGWNRGGVFSVQVRDAAPVLVEIKATGADGRVVEQSAPSSDTLPSVVLEVPDGTWTIRYWLDGTKWETFEDVRFDATAPAITGLDPDGEADGSGTYVLGQGAAVTGAASLKVIHQDSGAVIATSLPVTLSDLADGIHAYDVIAVDEAGNEALEQVVVYVGAATALPDGQSTFGLVARYTVNALVWDLTALDTWATPAQAKAATGGKWLGSGRGIDPTHATVLQVRDEAVAPGMSSGEIALALYEWMADNLEYDRSRLNATTLLTPHQVLRDAENECDNQANRCGYKEPEDEETGLARDGEGNGVAGGVCRDLAATYVSLLRAAGVPARLVTGYLGGEVNGFHAWVEFYGGPNHGQASPWVPVDISSVGSSDEPGEQGYDVEVALQAFGLRHTDMLPLRVVTEEQEDEAWSAAVRLASRYPEGDPPQVELAKDLGREFASAGMLCVDAATLYRKDIASNDVRRCPAQATAGFPGFVRSASQVLDYGAEVDFAAPGTTLTLTLSYPDPAAVAPGTVVQATYGDRFVKDPDAGVTEAVWEP